MYSIEYQSDYILIISNSNAEIYIICLDDVNPKIVKINTFFTSLDNDMIEESIKKVLHNGGYDIKYEIELYRNSKFYQNIKEYNQEKKNMKKLIYIIFLICLYPLFIIYIFIKALLNNTIK